MRFGAEAEPPAADASGQEPFPTEIPVSLDLGEVLSIESLSVAEPELPSLSGPGRNPNQGSLRPGRPAVAESGADFPDCDTAVAETVAESVLDSVPADGQEPAGVVAEPAEIPAEPAAGPIAEAEPPGLPGWFPILKPRLRKKFLRPNRLEIAPARKCRLKILRRHPNRMGIPVRRSLPVCRGHPGRKGQPPPGTSPHTGKHPRGCPNRKQLPDQGRKRALPTRLPERGRILRQRRSRSRRPCSASKSRPSATAINSG